MKKLNVTFLLIAFQYAVSSTSLKAQQTISWADFSDITYVEQYDSAEKIIYMMPVFSSKLKAINGKTVAITGYLFPIDPASGYYILKADNKPFGCCAAHIGNPNELIELRFDAPNTALLEKYAQRQITIVGHFELNENDVLALDLIIDSAEILSK